MYICCSSALAIDVRRSSRAEGSSLHTALARLTKDHEATQAAIAAAGAIAPLVALLDGNEGVEAQEEAAGAILALAENEGNRLMMITQAGGIGWPVMLLGCDNPRAPPITCELLVNHV